MTRTWTFIAFLMSACVSTAYAEQVEGLIETRILDFDPQSGVKSHHFFFIDFDKKTVTDAYNTGTTELFFGISLDSIRDNFQISNISFQDEKVNFVITGTTATGVGIVPSIDYKFSLEVEKSGSGSITGCHDGYPAYLVQINGKNVYEFKHKAMHVLNLFGSCDISTNTSF